ncbi:sodium:solute symporter [candidate division KSB1 bacterium]|nr:Na+:solute symporter [candidate division KSB1 bacterium]RQW05567.1 MAG: sodium:solute symporter [candidate division KSB1 bacterium]
MKFHFIDIIIIVFYIVLIIAAGLFLRRRASSNLDAYFLGGKSIPWWIIGTSHGASGFDITGTMWFVTMFFTYGPKAAFIPWVWPMFDRIFRQVYLGQWIRRSNALTGAEWMRTRFGDGRGGNLSHIAVVIYALVISIGFLGYAFQGIGKFAEVFFPWDLAFGPFASSDSYGIIILGITTIYLLLGGWYSVVLTDLIQFALLTVASIFIGFIALNKVSPTALARVVPANWSSPLFGKSIDIDWSRLIPQLNDKIVTDGYSLFGILISMWLLKGLLVSMAGPTPGYGMQHTLSTRSPRETALENWWMSVVQIFPRFFMIAGIGVLGLVYFSSDIQSMLAAGQSFDFEQILPYVIRDFVPIGLVGILIAGLLAAFMSTFDSTVNAGAAYIVNDIYKRYLKPHEQPQRYVRLGYLASILLVLFAIITGWRIQSIHSITQWIAVLLYSGYMAPNILKWHWWRFNGYGFFAGMSGGVFAALFVPALLPSLTTIYHFPIIFVISATASVLGCLLTPPESDDILKKFYLDVRPWGFWQPIYEKVVADHPQVQKNKHFGWDALNIVNGMIWQFMLTLLPIALIIRHQPSIWTAFVVLVVTSVMMKFTWYDRIGRDKIGD